jgi:RNA polymerase sigma-70 factor (ECF subfamily)
MYAVMEPAGKQHDEDKQRAEALFRNLIARIAQHRDRQAFGQLFDHFAPRLKSFMIRKNASSELAEDLVQEAMIAVWTKAGLYEPTKGSVTTWVFTIARNLRIDRIRRDVHMPTTELGDYDEPSEAPEGEELLGRKQEDGLVARALQSIPEEQRQILILSFVEDMPQSEIASKLSIPLGTVKSRMRLAYGHLRRILETGL